MNNHASTKVMSLRDFLPISLNIVMLLTELGKMNNGVSTKVIVPTGLFIFVRFSYSPVGTITFVETIKPR